MARVPQSIQRLILCAAAGTVASQPLFAAEQVERSQYTFAVPSGWKRGNAALELDLRQLGETLLRVVGGPHAAAAQGQVYERSARGSDAGAAVLLATRVESPAAGSLGQLPTISPETAAEAWAGLLAGKVAKLELDPIERTLRDNGRTDLIGIASYATAEGVPRRLRVALVAKSLGGVLLVLDSHAGQESTVAVEWAAALQGIRLGPPATGNGFPLVPVLGGLAAVVVLVFVASYVVRRRRLRPKRLDSPRNAYGIDLRSLSMDKLCAAPVGVGLDMLDALGEPYAGGDAAPLSPPPAYAANFVAAPPAASSRSAGGAAPLPLSLDERRGRSESSPALAVPTSQQGASSSGVDPLQDLPELGARLAKAEQAARTAAKKAADADRPRLMRNGDYL